jgi:hypothetical protein
MLALFARKTINHIRSKGKREIKKKEDLLGRPENIK